MTSQGPIPPDRLVVVSGLPRSGTSLMMQMIHAGGVPALTDHVRSADEDNPRGYFEFEAVKRTRQDPAWLDTAGGKVVKMVHLLLYDLPPGRSYDVVFMRRDLREVLASQRKMLQRHGKAGAALTEDQLIKVYQQQLDKLLPWLAGQSHFRVLEVGYNDLLAGPGPQVARLNAFLGGGLDEGNMLGAIDPSLYRNRLSSAGG